MKNKQIITLLNSPITADVKIGYEIIIRKYRFHWIVNTFILNNIRIYRKKDTVDIFFHPPYRNTMEPYRATKNIEFNINNDQEDEILWY